VTVAEVERIGSPDISTGAARSAYVEYRRALHVERDPKVRGEMGAAMRGYHAISKGQQVIDVEKAMKTAGLQPDTYFPRLAICRADATWGHVHLRDNGSAVFCVNQPYTDWRRIPKDQKVTFGPGTFTPMPRRRWLTEAERAGGRVFPMEAGKALVPMVPPQARLTYSARNYHVLWDAVWEPEPPKDPFLLKHLGGALYAIVHHWDLTPIEQAVMRGRL
jgi:hypothetical protein